MSEGEQPYKSKVREAFKVNRAGYRVDLDVLTEAAKLFVQSEQHREFLSAFAIFVGQVAYENGMNSLVTEKIEKDSDRIVQEQSNLMVQLEQIRTNIQNRKSLSEVINQIHKNFYLDMPSNDGMRKDIINDLKNVLSRFPIDTMVIYLFLNNHEPKGVIEFLRQNMRDKYPTEKKDQFVLEKFAWLVYKIYKQCTEALKAKAIISRDVVGIIKTSLNELLDV